MLFIIKNAAHEAGTGSLMIAGHAITIFSIVLNCFIAFIMLLIFVSDLFRFGNTREQLTQAPSNVVLDKTHRLMFMLFVNATIGTFEQVHSQRSLCRTQ